MTSIQISVFETIKHTKTPYNHDVYKILEYIKNGKWKDKVNLIQTQTDPVKKEELKKQLPAICFSGVFTERKAKGLIEGGHSGLICIDIDDIDNPQILKAEIIRSEYIFACFISPSGRGLKCLFRIPPNPLTHRDSFLAIEDWFKYDIDPSGKDIPRVCFAAYDPDIYINQNASLFDLEKPPPKKQEFIYTKDSSHIYAKLKAYAQTKWGFAEGQRNNSTFKLAGALNTYGVPFDLALSLITQDFEQIGFGATEIKTTVNSAYEHKDQFNTKEWIDRRQLTTAIKKLNKGTTPHSVKSELLETFPDMREEDADFITNTALEEFKSRYETFWWTVYDEKKDEASIGFDKVKYIDWLNKNGFFRYSISPKQYVFIKISNNIVEEVYNHTIKDYVMNYIETLPDNFDGTTRHKLKNFIMHGSKTYFSTDIFEFQKECALEFHKSTKETSYLYFINSVIKITADTVEQLDYKDINGIIWRSQIIDYSLDLTNVAQGEYLEFLNNVCNGDSQRFSYLQSILGYLLHDYKDTSIPYAVILTDEIISDNPEGGTGKGLFIRAIKQIRRTVTIDGKNFKFDKNFVFQQVNLDTKIVAFEDVQKKFDFESLFSVITDGITVEKKGKDEFHIPFSESPKLVITTNYTVQGQGNSHHRRRVEVEFAQYYNSINTPEVEFGHLLFDQWDDDQWNDFYNVMVLSIKHFLKGGIKKVNPINLVKKKFTQATSEEFVEWFDANVLKISGRSVKELREDFMEYSEYEKLSSRTWGLWLKAISLYTDFKGASTVVGGGNKRIFYLDPKDKFTPQEGKSDTQDSLEF